MATSFDAQAHVKNMVDSGDVVPQTVPMNPEVKAVWINALRSGEYTQTQGVLRRVNGYENASAGFCCLGVLCDIAAKQGLNIAVGPDLDDPDLIAYDGLSGVLPTSVLEWAGISNNAGMYGDDTDYKYLSAENDNGKTFAEIADIIEAEF